MSEYIQTTPPTYEGPGDLLYLTFIVLCLAHGQDVKPNGISDGGALFLRGGCLGHCHGV
jgi:hypothetical protein